MSSRSPPPGAPTSSLRCCSSSAAPRPDLRCAADHLHGDVRDLPTRARARAPASRRGRRCSRTPANSGRSVPKSPPMSPSPAAESSASTDRVDDRVTVAVPGEPRLVRASRARPGEAARRRRRRARRSRHRRDRRATAQSGPSSQVGAVQVVGGRDLERPRVAGRPSTPDGRPRRTARRRRCGRSLGRGVGRDERGPREALRGLHGDQFAAVDGLDDGPVDDALDGVGDGQHRDDAASRRANRVGDPVEHLGRGEGPCRIVHEHDIHLVGERRQARGDRLLARCAARDHDRRRAGFDLGVERDDGARVFEVGRRRHHDQLGVGGNAHRARGRGSTTTRARRTPSEPRRRGAHRFRQRRR